MTVTHSVRIDEELDRRVRAEAKRRHKHNVSDMLRDLIAHGFEALPPLDTTAGRITNVDPLPAKALREMYSRPEMDEASIKRAIAAQPKGVGD